MMINAGKTRGFTLIETVFSITLFLIVVMGIFSAYQALYRSMAVSEHKLLALEIVSSELERLENIAFAQIVSQNQSSERNNIPFMVDIFVVNIDDPFDGVAPADTEPVDYKLVEVRVDCSSCRNFSPVVVTGRFTP